MTSLEKALTQFVEFAAKLKGDEKSEAQTFLFHLLEAFGHDPTTLPEGSTFEHRVRFAGQRTKFADFVWPGRCLIEMKSCGEKLSKHYQQTFDYWLNLVPHRPPYVVLCNFDEFWIYDFNTQLQEPMDRLHAPARPLGNPGQGEKRSGDQPRGYALGLSGRKMIASAEGAIQPFGVSRGRRLQSNASTLHPAFNPPFGITDPVSQGRAMMSESNSRIPATGVA